MKNRCVKAYTDRIDYAYKHSKQNGVEIDDSHVYLDSIGYKFTPEEVAGYYLSSRTDAHIYAYSDWLDNIQGKVMDESMRITTKILAKYDTNY
jgi:hypothetical protein